MDQQEKDNFLTFLNIFTSTKNVDHAALESGWSHPHSPDGKKATPEQSIDFTQIPRSQWRNHLASSVKLTPHIQTFIDTNDQPLTITERHAIGEALEVYYQLAPDYCIIDTPEGDFYLETNT